MTFHKGAYVALLLAVLLWLVPAGLSAQSDEEKLNLDFKEIELPALIQTISELTGKNFVYDETVKGTVTISSPVELTRGEAYNLFLTVLNVKGFTVVPSGKINKIIPTRDAKESNLPTSSRVSGEQYVTRLIPLRNADATVLATTVLPPLLPKTSYITAFAPANTLVITDSASNIERLAGIVRELDIASAPDRLEIIPLQFASAEEVAKVCSQVLTQGAASSPRARGRAVQATGGTESSKVIPYPRTNTLVVMATNEDIVTIKALILELDQKPSQQRSNINVYYLENADATILAQTLNDILNKVQTSTTATAMAKTSPAQETEAATAGPVSIIADKPTNSLIVNATPADFDVIKEIIGQLDIKRKQVYVEALIMELSMEATKNLGMSLQGAVSVGSDGAAYFSTGPSAATPLLDTDGDGASDVLTAAVDGIMMGGLFNPITITNPLDKSETITVPALSALIELSKTDSDVNILSAPRLLTSDNEEAEIVVGSNVPIITSRLTDTGGSSGLAQSVSVERKDVALTLRFTPQITEGEQVRLQVNQEITDIATTSVGDVDQVGPTLTKRLLRNTVVAENGKTVVLGGLIRNNQREFISKVPLLGDIPVLGWLFKKKSTTEEKTNLLVFITPKIIRDAGDLEKVTDNASKEMDLSRLDTVASDTVVDNLKPAPDTKEPRTDD